MRLARPASRDPRVAFSGAELELEHLLAHYRHGWREAVLAFHAWSQPGEPVSLPWPPWDQVSLRRRWCARRWARPSRPWPCPRGRDVVGAPPHGGGLDGAAWADGLHRALEVAERPGMAERLPVAPAPGGSPLLKGARIERRGAWEGALYRLATPQEPAPEGLREALGERASAGLEGLLRLGPDDLQALVSGALDVVDSLRQRNGVPPGPEQHPRWLRRDWGRWRRAAALRPRSTTWPARRPASPWPWPPPRTAARLAPHAERRPVPGPPWPCAGPPPGRPRPRAGRAGRGARAQDGPEDRHPAEDWAPPPDPALPDAGPAAPAGRGASGKGASGTARRRGARPGGGDGGLRAGGPGGAQGGGAQPGGPGGVLAAAGGPGPGDRAVDRAPAGGRRPLL